MPDRQLNKARKHRLDHYFAGQTDGRGRSGTLRRSARSERREHWMDGCAAICTGLSRTSDDPFCADRSRNEADNLPFSGATSSMTRLLVRARKARYNCYSQPTLRFGCPRNDDRSVIMAVYSADGPGWTTSAHGSRQKTTNGGAERSLDRPNHGPSGAIGFRNHGIVGHGDPFAVNADAVVAVL